MRKVIAAAYIGAFYGALIGLLILINAWILVYMAVMTTGAVGFAFAVNELSDY